MGIIQDVAEAVAAIVGTALSRLVAEDVKEWTPRITDCLIDHAAKKLPKAQRDRFAEEWRSHASDTPGCIAKLVTAAGCICAAHQIHRDMAITRERERWETFRQWIQKDGTDAFWRVGAGIIVTEGSASRHDVQERLQAVMRCLSPSDVIKVGNVWTLVDGSPPQREDIDEAVRWVLRDVIRRARPKRDTAITRLWWKLYLVIMVVRTGAGRNRRP